MTCQLEGGGLVYMEGTQLVSFNFVFFASKIMNL